MKNYLSIFLVILLILPMSVLAHDEVDPDPEAWKKSISFGYNMTDGNSNTDLLTIDMKARREKGNDIWNFQLRESYGQTEDATGLDTTNVDETIGIAEYRHLISERAYFGALVNAERDDIADIDYRAIPSLVFGYFLIKNETMDFAVEAGPGYVFEKVGGVKDDYFAPRVGEIFNWQFSENARFFEYANVTFDTDNSDNYLIVGEAGVEAALNEMLSLIVSVKDNYDNVPAPGLKRNDIILTSSVGLRW